MKSLSACLLFLVGLVTPILTWADELPPYAYGEAVVQALQQIADNPVTKFGGKVGNQAAKGKVCGPTFMLEAGQLLGTGKLCHSTLTGERYFSLSVLGCYIIQSRGNDNQVAQVLVFHDNAQARYQALLTAGTPNLEMLSGQGCRVNISLPKSGFMATAIRIVRSVQEL